MQTLKGSPCKVPTHPPGVRDSLRDKYEGSRAMTCNRSLNFTTSHLRLKTSLSESVHRVIKSLARMAVWNLKCG